MRIVIVGASDVGVMTAQLLLDAGHELVVIDTSRERIDELYEDLDVSFLCGDGSRPAILREADPVATDVLFCLSGDDRVNIIAALVGRSLGFTHVVASINDPQYEAVCAELGLERTIVPPRTISRYLADMVEGQDVLELSTFIRGDARFFAFPVDDALHGRTVAELDLPEGARAICFYRGDAFALADPATTLREGDEVVLLTRRELLGELQARWQPTATTTVLSEPPAG